MIELKNVHKSFAEKSVLQDVSASFRKGKINLVIGASGSGKTVLMKCMVGLLESDSGQVLYDGRVFSDMDFDARKKIRKEIGMLFQGTALFDSLTVEENIQFPLKMFVPGMSHSEKHDRVNFCLERVKLAGVNHLYPAELSGGMKKRVGLARAIVQNPMYLCCDEPNSGLDPQTSKVIDELIRQLTEDFNTTTVINTHDMNSVMNIGDHIIFLYQGKKNWEGARQDVLTSASRELDDFIFVTDFLKQLKQRSAGV